MRPLVVVSGRSASSSSWRLLRWASTSSVTVWRRSNLCGYGAIPRRAISSRFALRCAICSSCDDIVRSAVFIELLADPVQHAVDELHRVFGAERAGELEGFVDDHRRGRAALLEHLTDGEPEDQPVDDGHPFGPPVLGGRGDQRIDALQPPHGVMRELGCKRLELRIGLLAGPLMPEEGLRRVHDVGAADLPLIQDLQRRLPAAVPDVLSHDERRPSAAAIAAISIAAAAASQPLLVGPSPARASASSAELVVSTPNVIGTPVSADACVRPCATADEMY